MLFDPARHLVGELREARCDVWDLDEGLYRGAVDATECARWQRDSPPWQAPARLGEQTPQAPAGSDGTLVVAKSRDGQRLSSGRRGLSQILVWDAAALAPRRTVTIPEPRSGAGSVTLTGLVFTEKNELVALTLPAGPVLWKEEGEPSVPLDNGSGVEAEALFVDPEARYVGYSGSIRAKVNLDAAGVLRLADGKLVLAHAEVPRFTRRRVLWADEKPVAVTVDASPIPVEACEDESFVVSRYGIEDRAVDELRVERGKLDFFAVAPDGAVALIAVTEMEPCTEENLERRAKKPVMHLLGRGLHRTIEGAASSAVFGPAGATVTVTLANGSVAVFDLTAARPEAPPRRIASWKGTGPLAFAPDGQKLASVERGVLTVREPRHPSPPRPLLEGAVAAAFGARFLAVATAHELSFFDGATLSVGGKLPIEGITWLAWNRPGTRLGAHAGDRIILADPAGGTPFSIAVSAAARTSWAADGALVIREEKRVRRFVEVGGAWTAVAERSASDRDAVSAGGDFEFTGDALRRLADGEALHLTRGGSFTESGAFDTALPGDWFVREGDVLSGRLLKASSASFLHPTPDLVTRFVTGAPIPHPSRGM